MSEKFLCKKCNNDFPIECFPKDKTKKNGIRSYCKKCYSLYLKEYRERNKEYFKKYRKNRYDKKKEEIKQKSLNYYYDNREHRIFKITQNKNNNKEKYKQYSKNYVRERSKKDLHFKLKRKMGNLIYQKLRYNKKNISWQNLVDFTIDDLKYHLEALMKPGMTWENYGIDWHIDHFIPDSWFEYSSPEDGNFKASWNLWNLQPMWAKENIKKSNKFAK